MGAHASWPLFTLAHHLVVEYAAHKGRIPNAKAKYRLIGDDVIIRDAKVWTSYLGIMQALGLTINFGKTVISPQSCRKSGAEIAKQLYLNGKCLTPLTPGFVQDLRKPHMFNECVGILRARYGESVCPEFPSTLITVLFPKERKQKLVWLLATNPVTGIIKPGNPGYDELSPWTAEQSAVASVEYRKIFAQHYVELATSKLAEMIPYAMMQGSPWNDQAHPQPKCLRRAFKDTMFALSESLNRVKVSFFESDLDSLKDEVSYVPDPNVPYMERKELVHRITSSSIVALYRATAE
jgi:hypothetical protein